MCACSVMLRMLKTNDSYCFDDQVDEKVDHGLNHDHSSYFTFCWVVTTSLTSRKVGHGDGMGVRAAMIGAAIRTRI